MEKSGNSTILGPLTFDELDSPLSPTNNSTITLECLLCEQEFNFQLKFEEFLQHLFEQHKLVIEDVQNIQNLAEYLKYWKNKFRENRMEEIIPSVKLDSNKPPYYLLSTLLKDDKELRHKLKLEHALKVQKFEWEDSNYSRQCLFCKVQVEGTRLNFLEHLSNRHNFHLGNPQNLVFIGELIEKIGEKLANLQCIYCHGKFPERNILKEHMRKKLHKRINQQDSDYDKYFVLNYLEPDKNWRKLRKESDSSDGEPNSDGEYFDWKEKEFQITCLFCKQTENDIKTLCLHMEADHDFDFPKSTLGYDFYKKIKLINYIRRQIHCKACIYCNLKFDVFTDLQQHLYEEKHCKIPSEKEFDQPEFYFPTYENDAFLYLIDDLEDSEASTLV